MQSRGIYFVILCYVHSPFRTHIQAVDLPSHPCESNKLFIIGLISECFYRTSVFRNDSGQIFFSGLKANDMDVFQWRRGSKIVAWSEINIYIYFCIYMHIYVCVYMYICNTEDSRRGEVNTLSSLPGPRNYCSAPAKKNSQKLNKSVS